MPCLAIARASTSQSWLRPRASCRSTKERWPSFAGRYLADIVQPSRVGNSTSSPGSSWDLRGLAAAGAIDPRGAAARAGTDASANASRSLIGTLGPDQGFLRAAVGALERVQRTQDLLRSEPE